MVPSRSASTSIGTPLIVIAFWGLTLRIGQHGLTPDRIVASKYTNDLAQLLNMPTGRALSTRPLCAYPAVARWKGEGATNDEANFECVVPPPATTKS